MAPPPRRTQHAYHACSRSTARGRLSSPIAIFAHVEGTVTELKVPESVLVLVYALLVPSGWLVHGTTNTGSDNSGPWL